MEFNKLASVLFVVLATTIAACSPLEVTTEGDATNENDENLLPTGGFSPLIEEVEGTQDTQDVEVEDEEPQTQIPDDGIPTKVVKEGERVALSTRSASDPDNDEVQYIFPEQFDERGVWQTQIGDAGEYVFPIQVTDGEFTSELQVRVIVESVNAAPVIDNFQNVVVSEGERIVLNPAISDREGDSLEIRYSGFMSGPEYQTNFEDAGAYTVTLTVSDPYHTVEREISVVVNDRNRRPILQPFSDLIAEIGEIVVIEPIASDPDGDDLSITFSEPFDETGTFATQSGDEGEYEIRVGASDGDLMHEQVFTLVVSPENSAPVVSIDSPVRALEGTTLELVPVATDIDGDEIYLTYSGFMTSSSRYLDFDSSGQYVVTITASDGRDENSVEVAIIVEDVNRPPEFTGDLFE